MKKIVLLSAFLGLLSFQVSAQSKKEKITELFLLMKVEDQSKSMFDNMTNMTGKMFQHENSTGKDARKDSIFRAYVKEEAGAMSKRMLETDMPEIYDKYFTISEIQKYIDFYKTPEGKKMLDITPVITKEIVTNMMSKEMPALREKFKKKLEELENSSS